MRKGCDTLTGMAVSNDGALLVTISRDQSVKVFDVPGFDMVLMLKLPFVPAAAEWIFRVRLCLRAVDLCLQRLSIIMCAVSLPACRTLSCHMSLIPQSSLSAERPGAGEAGHLRCRIRHRACVRRTVGQR
jgi:hypothetical protein